MKREKLRLRPTGLWLIFGPVLGCMWLAAVNYSNNLVYATLYLVASLTFVSIFYTWRNLAPLRVEHIRVNPAFVGEEVKVEIFLRNPGRQTIYGLSFARLGEEVARWRGSTPLLMRGRGTIRLEGEDSCTAEVFFPALRRGMYRLEALLVRTSFPFGLMWASFRVPVEAVYYIYPAKKGSDDWPELRPGGEDGSVYSPTPGDDFAGVRPYMPGESLRHVDWKAYARGRPLSVKQFSGGAGRELWLDAADLNRMQLEERLSQMALWITNAEKEEIPYALRLGRATLPLGLGPAQARRALEMLAVAGAGEASKGI
ncbi:MAG: DUF58 domain-containing protein [Methylacidiphilales bacterium]|nr:DUF58 domain-containing protein [Candidatus Methylacidiphilales bacterium]